MCRIVIDNSLEYLAKQSIPIQYKQTPVWNHISTCLAGLAFIAQGSTQSKGKFRSKVSEIKRYVCDSVPEIGKPPNERNKELNFGANTNYAWSALFLTELYMKEPDSEIRKILEYISGELNIARSSDGLWHYKGLGSVTDGGHTATTNFCLLAVGSMERIGIPTCLEKYQEKTRKTFTTKIVRDDGYCNRYVYRGKPTEDTQDLISKDPGAGRTAATLLALRVLKGEDTQAYKQGLKYLRANIHDVMTYHTPQLYVFLTAVLCYRLGREEWGKFNQLYRDTMLGYQAEDGRVTQLVDKTKFPDRGAVDYQSGPYTTALFVLILQLPLGHLSLAADP